MKEIGVLIIGGFITLAFQTYSKEAPNVSYSVSDAIEIVGTSGRPEYAQEIAVGNIGNSAAKSISVKVPRSVLSYKLTKHSNLLKEVTSTENESFELVYPELPTGQKFRLHIRYGSAPISRDWISVSYAEGNAQPQDNQSSGTNYFLLWIAAWFGFVAAQLFSIRESAKQFLIRTTNRKDLFRNSRPWYIFANEWPEFHYEMLEHALNAYSYESIDQKLCFQLLNHEKPKLLTDDNWTKLQNIATDKLNTALSSAVAISSDALKLADLLKLKKPELFPLEHWSRFQNSVGEMLESRLLPSHLGNQELIRILEKKHPIQESLPTALALRILEAAQNRYLSKITNEAIRERDGASHALSEARLDLLTEELSSRLRTQLIQLSRMQAMLPNWSLNKLEGIVANGKPSWMSEEEFIAIVKAADEMESLSTERASLKQKRNSLVAAEEEVTTLKRKVTAQLELIDRILSSPDSIDKLEEYDDTFAPGNRRNLELVARTLKSKKAD